MVPASAILGLASSIISIAVVAKSLYGTIHRIRCHPKRKQHLQALVKDLVEKLDIAAPHFDAACADQTRRELEEIKAMFESLGTQSSIRNCMWSCITFPVNDAKLDEVERKLESLILQVILQLGLRRVCNDKVEGPTSTVGIDRSKSIFEFLQRSQQEALRVICISGQPGVGKTTLLDHIWEEVSLKAPFLARAYVRVGENPSDTSLCLFQSHILQQLEAGRLEFSSPVFGRGEAVKHFKRLKSNNRPIMLAIDNVWEVEDLQKLLPSRMTSDLLPSFSCIMLTCRDVRLMKSLLNICELQEENHSQVFVFTPKCLSQEDSLQMFAETAKMDPADHQELLQEVVPLCGGLPLAITVLARIFTDEARRGSTEWKRVVEGMSEHLSGHDEEASPVMKSLQLSYQRLSPTHKAAFLDVATVYYDLSWEIVERAVDAKVLNDLKDSSLLSQTDGYMLSDILLARELHMSESSFTNRQRVRILMHDLTLKFGRSLVESLEARSTDHFDTMANLEDHLRSLNPRDVRYLEIIMPSAAEQEINSVLLQFLSKAKNLQTLHLETKPQKGFDWDTMLDGNLTNSRGRQLRFLHIKGCNNTSLLMQTMLLSGIRYIELWNCDDLVELPSIPLRNLERLTIESCQNLESFSNQCVEGWSNLKELRVSSCRSIKEVPDALGRLPQLKLVLFYYCENLQKFASLCNPGGPVDLILLGCDHLQVLPPISCQLRSFYILNAPIATLNVDENAWQLLSVLSLNGCKLEVLPESIYRATAVQAISLARCTQLRELPDVIEGLQSLRRLSLEDCNALQRLPSPALGNCRALQHLSIVRCNNLVEMPDEIGKLTSLIKLDVSGCKNLRRLPSTIGSALCLQELNARKCEKLVELPDEIGNLTSLMVLDVSGCKKLKQLPAGIRNALSLKKLFASVCENLVELPDELGKLSLTHLNVSFCSNLEEFINRSTARRDFVLLNSLRCLSVCELPRLDDTWKFALGMGGCGDWSDIIPDSLAGLTELRLSSSRSFGTRNWVILTLSHKSLVEIDWFLESKSSTCAESDCDPEVDLWANFYVNLFELPNEIEEQQPPAGLEALVCAFSTELERLKKGEREPFISRSLNNLSVWEGKIPKTKLTHLHLCSVKISILDVWPIAQKRCIMLQHSIVYSSTTAGKDGLSKWPEVYELAGVIAEYGNNMDPFTNVNMPNEN